MGDREEGNAVVLDALDAGIGVEHDVEEEVAALVRGQPDRSAREELSDGRSSPIHTVCGFLLLSLGGGGRWDERNRNQPQQ
jgi:hypothetical protein